MSYDKCAENYADPILASNLLRKLGHLSVLSRDLQAAAPLEETFGLTADISLVATQYATSGAKSALDSLLATAAAEKLVLVRGLQSAGAAIVAELQAI